jgi:hypothetical protein
VRFLLYALLVYASLIGIAIAWARHCLRRPAERDPHTHMYEVPHHVR